MRKWMKAIVFVSFLMICYFILLGSNLFQGDYTSLNRTDQAVLSELDQYFKADAAAKIWPGFDLGSKSIVAVNGRLGKAYLINPEKQPSWLFAKKLTLPEDYTIQAYRVSAFAPQLLPFREPGNFNTNDITYRLFGNDVYYTRYDDSSFEKKYDSGHYITFLTHESFHYYMQGSWSGGSRLNTDILTENDLNLLDEHFQILTKIQNELSVDAPQREKLLALTREYLNAMEKRIAENPAYLHDEQLSETAEGTATYVGIHASKAVGYDFAVMHFYTDHLAVLSFDMLVPGIRDGYTQKSALSTSIVYESGALLCELIEQLGIPDWKQQLNAQTIESPVTLYSILKGYMESLPQENNE